jgi:hypothetical protein
MKNNGLEIDQNLDFQRREWRYRRIGIAVLFTFVLAALLGVTGMGGPLSRGSASDPEGRLVVEYERFVRRNARSQVRLRLASKGGEVRIAINTAYLNDIALRSIVPRPEAVVTDGARQVLVFRSSSPQLAVQAEIEPLVAGSLDAEVSAADGPTIRFRQWSIF